MGLVETEAFVLKSYNLAEADKIVIFLTQHFGLVRGVAKGAKRLKSRFGGAVEPFSIVQLTYFQKEERELVSIRQIDLVKSYFEIASKPRFFQAFAYLAELLSEFAPPHDPDETLYRMTKVCLEAASEVSANLDAVVFYFELWILRLGGYLPDWTRCEECRRKFDAAEVTSRLYNFHLVCGACRKSGTTINVTPQQRSLMKTAQQVSPVKFLEFSADKFEDINELSKSLKKIIFNVLGKELTAEKSLIAKL